MSILSASRFASRYALRQELRARRRAIGQTAQRAAARRLAQRLARLPELQQARRIALYWPQDGEIDPRALLQQRQFARRHFYLPVLQRFPPESVRFARWTPRSQRLYRNRFDIPEPRRARPLAARHMQVILLPLTGFDAQGNRLGMGGGFYDRSLRAHRRRHVPLLIGVAHAVQQVDELAAEAWDIPLDGVVTDSASWRFR